MAEQRHYILGAAGHVDHGKTALITALTGTNTDRLKEEQERGISIELGFAEFALDDEVLLGVVDMPGHERFVKQMVSGAGGVDLAFLVVAADEGVMPQTVEHLEILDSLGTGGGVVVMTKIDLVDEDILAVATEEARELVAGTFLEGRPIVPVSARAGLGLTELKAALRAEALALPVRREDGPFRLPIDRVFSLPGVGVVITGTCWSGSVGEGDRLTVEPGGRQVRVREVQVHGRSAGRGASGQRLALALHGVKKDDLERGFQVLGAGAAGLTRRLAVRVNLMPHYTGVMKNRQRLHVHHAGREVLARIVLLDAAELGGDGGVRTGLAHLHLEDDLVAARGDRLVLRFYSPVTTIAGGVVIDTSQRRYKRFDEQTLQTLDVMEHGDPAQLFRQKLATAGLVGLPLGEALGQQDDPAVLQVGKRLYDKELLDELAGRIDELVQAYARRFPLRLGVPKEEARRKCKFKSGANEWHALCVALAERHAWCVVGDRICASSEGPTLSPPLAEAVEQIAAALHEVGLNWPGLAVFAEAVPVFQRASTEAALKDLEPVEALRHLVDHRRAVQVGSDYYVHVQAQQALLTGLRHFFAEQDDLSFAQFRELSGLTRKLGIPLLEHLDNSGVTERAGDVRHRGPRLAANGTDAQAASDQAG